MSDIALQDGLTIRLPEDYDLDRSATARGRRRSTRGGAPAVAQAVLLDAMKAQDFQLVRELTVRPAPTARPAIRGVAIETEAAVVLDVAVHEDAVLLVERDGCFEWRLASSGTTVSAAAAPRRMRRAPGVGAMRRLTFQVPLAPPAVSHGAGRRRGKVVDWLAAQAANVVKTYILKFAARAGVTLLTNFLEQNVKRGFVVMNSNEPDHWPRVERLADVPGFRSDRPMRLLLFLHGTFSNTVGSFGALTASLWGRSFLDAVRANYDAVIGFDHSTLAEDPRANAADLLQRFGLASHVTAPVVDVVAFSRGGLVFRSWVEELLPGVMPRPQIRLVVFVGSTLSGTLLAEAKNWQRFIDLYTNMAVAAASALGQMPSFTAKKYSFILNASLQSIGGFLKYIATAAITEQRVPGLAAMDPNGLFVRRLNQTQLGQPTIEKAWYAAITSEFRATLALKSNTLRELPVAFLRKLVETGADQLMQAPNDLVVNTESMTMIDPQMGQFIKEKYEFGPNASVYHTNYFTRPEVANKLARWFQLTWTPPPEPKKDMWTGRRRAPHLERDFPLNMVPTSGITPWLAAEAPLLPVDQVPVPAQVDTDVITMSADLALKDAVEEVNALHPSYVVIHRDRELRRLNYVYSAEELLAAARTEPRNVSLIDTSALNIHEYTQSPVRGLTDSMTPPAGRDPTSRRAVVVDDEEVIGVIPEIGPLPTMGDLVQISERIESGNVTANDMINLRRTLPTLDGGGGRRRPRAPVIYVPPAPRRKRGQRGRPPRPAQPQVPLTQATLNFRAQVSDEAVQNEVASVIVTISRTLLGPALYANAAEATAAVELERDLIVQLHPRRGVRAEGEARTQVKPPTPDKPVELTFDFMPLDLGEGEAWILARQGPESLATLKLKFRVVARPSGKSVHDVTASAVGETSSTGDPSLFQLRIFQSVVADGTSYEFELFSDELNVSEYDTAGPFPNESEFIHDLYEGIEQLWEDDADEFLAKLREKGATLFAELVPAKIQQALWQHRGQIKGIEVISTEPSIPWELVHIVEPGEALGNDVLFLGQMGMVRTLHGFRGPKTLRIRPRRARHLVPVYADPAWALPEAQKEIPFLEHSFASTPLESKTPALRDLLRQGNAFDLLHFAGHGEAQPNNINDACVIVGVDGARPDRFMADTVKTFAKLRGEDGSQPIVVLNACQAGVAGARLSSIGGFARAFIERGAGLFIGALWSVGDSPARTFTEAFYQALLAGKTVSEAATAGRKAAADAGDATWLAYCVYGHPNAHLRMG
jgi:hypothetical protein